MIYAKGVAESELDEGLVRRLDKAEFESGLEFTITSGYRGADGRCHGDGKAVDIRARSSAERFEILEALIRAGFDRLGVYTMHIHADVCVENHARDVLWLGGASK